uniref:hypothetical protein n=1 Tax=Catenulispora pinisilvae TaxID=2705253 RepID=UPI001891072A
VGAGSGSHTASADGIMPAAQWPGYDIAHWTVSPNCGLADRSKCIPGDPTSNVTSAAISLRFGTCTPGQTYPVRRFVQYATQYDTAHKLDADETVLTFPDHGTAAAYLADAHAAGSPKICPGTSGATSAPGVSTADGLSWVVGNKDAVTSYAHGYLVQVGDRVAVLRVNQMDADSMQSTANDELVLADMEQALAE